MLDGCSTQTDLLETAGRGRHLVLLLLVCSRTVQTCAERVR